MGYSEIAIPRQTHSANVEIVHKPGIYKDRDALVTKVPGVILTIQTADCFPVFIYDPIKHVCAIVHSGWRGTVQNIVGNTIEKMISVFNCISENILIAIGPGIQQDNYQIDIKTAYNFEKDFLKDDGDNHFKLDIQGKIIDQIKKTGIKKHNIEFDTRCTFEEQDLFYSYRRDGSNSGRMMGVMGLL